MITNLLSIDYSKILSGAESTKARFQLVISNLIQLSDITDGVGAPTYKAPKHTQYFDNAASKYYRNIDGGTTWVALN